MAPSNDQPGQDLAKVVTGEAPVRITDPEEVSLAIVRRILNAPTVEDVFNMQTALSTEDVLNKPFILRSAEFRKSAFEEGSPVFGVLQIIDQDGAEQVVTCGGRNVMAQIARLQQLMGSDLSGLGPVKLIQTARPTAAGFYPLWLQPVEGEPASERAS